MPEIDELIEEDDRLREKAKESIQEVEECHRCGWCCANKRILVTIPEMVRILRHTGKRFSDIFVVEKNKLSVSIRTKKINGKRFCIFYDNGLCRIHEVKPFQCMTYPVIFHPFIFKINPPILVGSHKYMFTCQSPSGAKARYTIYVRDFNDITQARLALLEENYFAQILLIRKRNLKRAIEEITLERP